VQHYNSGLDGDMAGGIVPEYNVSKVLKDPLGLNVLINDSSYANPNRYFAHYVFYKYYRVVPLFLQNFTSPINSVYIANAIIKTLIQLCYIILLAKFCNPTISIFNKKNLLSMAIITPLFQTNGYRSYIGIIDPSPTYTFFYALPLLIFLIFVFIIYYKIIKNCKLTLFQICILIILLFYIPLSGPLLPGIQLVLSIVTIGFLLFNKQAYNYYKNILNLSLKYQLNLIFILINLLCIYSLYIGQNNVIFTSNQISIIERYLKLPIGLYNIITQKLSYSLLIGNILISYLFLSNNKILKQKLTLLLISILSFSVIYILLLPLGGYKDYRPYIIRYDTFMPISILIFIGYLFSSLNVISIDDLSKKQIYVSILLCISFIFINSDKIYFNKNQCEKESLSYISNSKKDTVFLNNNCNVLGWANQSNLNNELNSKLLKIWNITSSKKTIIFINPN
jgi:hypothetical protein